MTNLEIFFWGCVGGVLAEIGHLFSIRKYLASKVPRFLKSKIYWILTIGMIICGGILSVLNFYDTSTKSAMLVAEVGIIAPLLIHNVVRVSTRSKTGAKSVNKIDWVEILRGN
jgi:hypothetical protein